MSEEEEEFPESSLRNIVESNLKWIFVGGKGGVGKTTTSCSLAVQLAKVKSKVLVVSTDPAHNLSDAFSQKFTKDPTLVNGFDNLFCMEIEPSVDWDEMNGAGGGDSPMNEASNGIQSLMQDLSSSIPGIDEAMSFAELMKQVQVMDYEVIVFDTAPTGHTLRLLSFPTLLEGAFSKIMALKNKFGGLLNTFMGQSGMPSEDMLLGKLEQTREVINKVNTQFKDPEATSFVCVCIPEFLSLYETERLVQELTKFGIDTHCIVVNQVLFPDKDVDDIITDYAGYKDKLPDGAKDLINKLIARKKMQDKYINQIFDLYEDFHVVLMPLLDHEVRGTTHLKEFSANLVIAPEA